MNTSDTTNDITEQDTIARLENINPINNVTRKNILNLIKSSNIWRQCVGGVINKSVCIRYIICKISKDVVIGVRCNLLRWKKKRKIPNLMYLRCCISSIRNFVYDVINTQLLYTHYSYIWRHKHAWPSCFTYYPVTNIGECLSDIWVPNVICAGYYYDVCENIW